MSGWIIESLSENGREFEEWTCKKCGTKYTLEGRTNSMGDCPNCFPLEDPEDEGEEPSIMAN